MLCVGLFGSKDDIENISQTPGIAKGGPFKFFGYQCAAALSIIVWVSITTAIQVGKKSLTCVFI